MSPLWLKTLLIGTAVLSIVNLGLNVATYADRRSLRFNAGTNDLVNPKTGELAHTQSHGVSMSLDRDADDDHLTALGGELVHTGTVPRSKVDEAWSALKDDTSISVDASLGSDETTTYILTNDAVTRSVDTDEGTVTYSGIHIRGMDPLQFEYIVVCSADESKDACHVYMVEQENPPKSGRILGCRRLGERAGTRRLCCFSGLTKVTIENKGEVMLKDLQIGDRVLASNGEFKTVYSFGGFHKDTPTTFLQIHFEREDRPDGAVGGALAPLEITSNHLIMVVGKSVPIPAGNVNVGDRLLLVTENQRSPQSALVTKIKTVVRNDAYSPLTVDGTIVTNGVLASNFATVDGSESVKIGPLHVGSHQFLNMAYHAPHRLLCAPMGSRLSSFCKNETYDADGYSFYTSIGRQLAYFATDQNPAFKFIIFCGVYSVALQFYLLEVILTHGIGVVVFGFGILTYCVFSSQFKVSVTKDKAL